MRSELLVRVEPSCDSCPVSLVRLAGRVKDEQIAALTAALDASLGRERRLELRLAEAERRAAGPRAGGR
jgi:hypothetical protein